MFGFPGGCAFIDYGIAPPYNHEAKV